MDTINEFKCLGLECENTVRRIGIDTLNGFCNECRRKKFENTFKD